MTGWLRFSRTFLSFFFFLAVSLFQLLPFSSRLYFLVFSLSLSLLNEEYH